MKKSNTRASRHWRAILVLVGSWMFVPGLRAATHTLTSPDKETLVTVSVTDKVYYSVQHRGKWVIWSSPMQLVLSDGSVLGAHPMVQKATPSSVRETIRPAWGVRSQIADEYEGLRLDFAGNYSLWFRAYNDGVAYRFETRLPSTIEVANELVEYRFLENDTALVHAVGDFQTSYEKFYTALPIDQIKEADFATLPVLIKQPSMKLAIVESDVFDYPGMYLMRRGENNRFYLNGLFPKAATKEEPGGWCQFNLRVKERAAYLAKTAGTRTFPWRAMIIADTDAELADNDLVYKLARPTAIPTEWIKPGLASWDWWNNWNLEGVPFETGVNNRTYEYYIDFAAKNNLPYVVVDEGWSDQFDLFLQKPSINIPALAKYAKERNVRLWLWAVWHTLDRQMQPALDTFARWGIAGVKVDFIDRDDQAAINFYERLAKEAAKRQIMVDYHGCSKPTGLHRTYPNVVNYEAVRGNEYNKFSEGVPPTHNVNLVFTRMLAGPMDYTPGAMRNSLQGDFAKSNGNPMSQGTRCHQLAMYVCYYAPFQMLCDAPTQYEKHPQLLGFLREVPTTWDDTKVLAAELGKYVVIARRKGNRWYIGALNDWTPRTLSVNLNALGVQAGTVTLIQDGINAHKAAGDYQMLEMSLSEKTGLTLPLKAGGGAVAVVKLGK